MTSLINFILTKLILKLIIFLFLFSFSQIHVEKRIIFIYLVIKFLINKDF